jgi:hypothetical protein
MAEKVMRASPIPVLTVPIKEHCTEMQSLRLGIRRK